MADSYGSVSAATPLRTSDGQPLVDEPRRSRRGARVAALAGALCLVGAVGALMRGGLQQSSGSGGGELRMSTGGPSSSASSGDGQTVGSDVSGTDGVAGGVSVGDSTSSGEDVQDAGQDGSGGQDVNGDDLHTSDSGDSSASQSQQTTDDMLSMGGGSSGGGQSMGSGGGSGGGGGMGGTDDAMNNNPDVASLVPPTSSPTVTPSYVPTTFTPVPTPTPTTVPIPAPSHHPTLSPSHDTDWKGEKPMVALDVHLENAQYPRPRSLGGEQYPWEYHAEPYRQTTLSPLHAVEGDYADANYTWTIVLRTNRTADSFGDDAYHEVILRDVVNRSIVYSFETAGKFYNVRLKETARKTGLMSGEGDGRVLTRIAEVPVICKYVRRELRKLTNDDRALYFDAMSTIYNLDDDTGTQLYGSYFRTGAYFTKKHLAAMSLEGCTPWHTGTVFLTSHAAMTREFEMALQSIYPVLAAPYWEYTLDSAKYGGGWPKSSPIFGDDFFGEFPTDAPFVVSSGALPYVPLSTDAWDSPEHSPWGYLMDNFASDKTEYVTRAASMCGLPTTAPLPTCAKMQLAASQSSNFKFRKYVETYYHAELHPLIGGAWDCKFGEVKTLIDQFPGLAPYAEDVLTDLGVLMRYAYAVQKNFSHGVLIPGMDGWSDEWGDVRCPQNCADPESKTDDVNTTASSNTNSNAGGGSSAVVELGQPTTSKANRKLAARSGRKARRALLDADDGDDSGDDDGDDSGDDTDDDSNDVFFDDDPAASHDPDVCTCTIDRVRIPLEEGKELTVEFAYHVLDDIELLDELSSATGTAAASVTKYDDDWPETYTEDVELFKGLGKRDSAELIMWFVKLMSYFPKAGPMQNILGSPADPIFWPSHGSWERLWHHLRLADKTELQNGSSVGTWSTWREEDDNDASVTCSWSAKSYSMLPFHDLMDYETTWDIESNYWQTYHLAPYYYYTNADLNRMFAPTNPELPFIFDELDWEHCDEQDDKADDDAFGRVSEEGVNDPNSTRISRDPLNNVTKRMGVDDDDDVATPRGANDDVTNDDDADLSHWDGDPTDDSDDDDDDDGFTGSGGSGISGGGTTGGGGTATGGGSSPVSDTDGLDEPARRRAAADADVPGVMRDAFSAGKAAFAPPAANDGLTDHEGFRARLRTNLWSRLGEQYHAQRAAKEAILTSSGGDGALDKVRQWLYDDPLIHQKLSFEDGTWKRTASGETHRRNGLSGAEARAAEGR